MHIINLDNLLEMKDGVHIINLDNKQCKGPDWILLSMDKNTAYTLILFESSIFFKKCLTKLKTTGKINNSQRIQNRI